MVKWMDIAVEQTQQQQTGASFNVLIFFLETKATKSILKDLKI